MLLDQDLTCRIGHFEDAHEEGLWHGCCFCFLYFYSVVPSPRPKQARWLAIECLLGADGSYSSDVWAYGVVAWEIFTLGAHPYANGLSVSIIVFFTHFSRR